MSRPSRAEVEELADLFHVDVKHVQPFLRKRGVALYKVVEDLGCSNLKTYIVYSAEARALACFPHIVGTAFERLNLALSLKVSGIILRVAGLEEYRDATVHLHVLRAGPGYKLHEGLRRVLNGLREGYIKPTYSRDRSAVSIDYVNFANLPRNRAVAVVAPDTIATGRAMVASLNKLVKTLVDRECEPEVLVLYGFISKPGLQRTASNAAKLGFKRVYAFALTDLTALASNEYDMVLYGPDLSVKGFRPLGSTTHIDVLTACAPYYVPGLDQPGDWSSRQPILFDGRRLEVGPMHVHLEGVRKAVTEVLERFGREEWFKSWHRAACERTLAAVDAVRERVIRELKAFTL